MKSRAFTLIELLIVVAIIAILAAIAVPNFLEAQTRAKISRTKNDMRVTNTALEAYAVDNNSYPNCHRFGITMANSVGTPDPVGTMILERLSTPVAYVSTVNFRDPFTVKGRFSAASAQAINALVTPTVISVSTDSAAAYNTYIYQSFSSNQRYTTPPDSNSNAALDTKSRAWILHSCGPDGNYYNLGGAIANDEDDAAGVKRGFAINMIYDATNGTVSRGSIWRTGGSASAGPTYKAGEALIKAIQTQR